MQILLHYKFIDCQRLILKKIIFNAQFNEIFSGNGIELNALLCVEHASGKIVGRLYEHPVQLERE